MSLYFRLLGYIKPYWKYFLGALICSIFMNALVLYQPQLIRLLTDNVLQSHLALDTRFQWLNGIVATFLGIVIIKGFFSYAQGYLVQFGTQSALKSQRNQIFRHLQYLPMAFFEHYRPGEIFSRISNDTTLSCTAYKNIVDLVNDLIVVTGALGWMVYKDWRMTLLALTASPLVGLAITRYGKMIAHITDKLQRKVADLTSVLWEGISGPRVIKSFSLETYESRKFEDRNEENFGFQMKLAQISNTQSPVVEFLAGLGIVIVIWYGALQVVHGTRTLGDMMAYWSFMILLTQPLNRITSTYTNFQQAKVAGARVFEILDAPAENLDPPDAIELPELAGRIELRDVTFSYDPARPVLNHLSLAIEPGQIVAFVGPNGAGKTSLVNLVARFYAPQEGAVLVDGHDLQRVKLDSLRRQIGIVPQETHLFGGTLRENISFGKLKATDEEIIAAATAANAHDFIQSLPHGYQTVVGDRGVGLSGGQRQRIAIARAFLRNPRILILDEATSSMDAESELQIQEAVERLMKGRTCLIIAHRLNSITNSDRTIVMEEGQIVEEGRHGELLTRGGLYSRLYEAHLKNLEVTIG